LVVLNALDELGYGVAWRCLDAQHFGVPQRRNRVFFVCRLGAPCPPEILFEREGVRGDLEAGGEAGEAATEGAVRGAEGGSEQRAYVVHAAESCAKERHAYETQTARSLDTTGGFASSQGGTVVSTLQGGGKRGYRVDAEGAAGGDLLPVVTKDEKEIAGGITARYGKGTDSDVTDTLVMVTGKTTHALTHEGHDASEEGTGRGTPLVAFDTTQVTSDKNYSNPKPGDPCHPLAAGAHPPAITAPMAVRRLTPLECERLQGVPDGHVTQAPGLSDSACYRLLGNGVAVPVVEWIAKRMRRYVA
jgi:DNA (cytosine-5)-methyltransferase 1